MGYASFMPTMKNLVHMLKAHRIDVLIVLLLLIVAGVPRLLGLGTFLTADEKNWIGRSYEFVRAFKDFRFNDMLQTTHPGVTTLWMAGASITVKMFVDSVPFSFTNLVHFVKASQLPIALANTLAVPVLYVFLRSLWPKRRFTAVAAALFVALDPFFIGYSRVVHVDALLASLLFLAALAIIIYAKNQFSRRWLIIAALFSAASLLTKFPAVFLFPFFVLVVGVYEWQNIQRGRIDPTRFKEAVLGLSIIVITVLLVWPALLWVPNPAGNLTIIREDISLAAVTPHDMTQEYSLNSAHYLYALATRTSPLIWLFIGGYFISRAWRLGKKRSARLADLAPELLLVSYIFFFVVMMTLGAKKGDRYILPVFPALDVLAALGFVSLVSSIAKSIELRMKHYESRVFRLVLNAVFVIPVIYLAFTVYSYHPYTIAYSNPLLPDNLSQELGWGEGLEQVGAWLSQQAPQATVASWYPEELAAFTSARVQHINAHEHPVVEYVVLYRNMFGRDPAHPANDFIDEYYRKQEPVFVATVARKEFAWVFAKRAFEGVLGELTPDIRVGQEMGVEHDALAGVALLLATYNGRANVGSLIVELKSGLEQESLYVWEIPLSSVEDNVWHQFVLPERLAALEKVFVEIRTVGTSPKQAPTIRYTALHDYRPSAYLFSKETPLTASDVRKGDLGATLLYEVEGEIRRETDTKLFQR